MDIPTEKHIRTFTTSSKVSMKLLITKETNMIAIRDIKPEPRFISTPQKLKPELIEKEVDIIDANKRSRIPRSIPFLNIENLPSQMNLKISKDTITIETKSTNSEIPLSVQSQGIGIIENGRRRNSI